MNRRPFLRALATAAVPLSAGCSSPLSGTSESLDSSTVFESHRFDGTELVVRFRDGVDVRRVALVNEATGTEYEAVERPAETVRFPVVFPDRLETYVGRSLHVTVETPDGTASLWVPERVHGFARSVETLPDGRARFEIENQGDAPLLVRFVAMYDGIPNPTLDPQRDSFDRDSLEFGPGVVGVGENRPLSPSRTDLVVPPGETDPFETTYLTQGESPRPLGRA